MSGFTSTSLPVVVTFGGLYFHTNIRLPSRLLPTVAAALLFYTGSLPTAEAAVIGNGRSLSFIDSIDHTAGKRFAGVGVSDEDKEQSQSPKVVAYKAPRVRQSSPPRTPWVVAQTTRGGTFRRRRHAAARAADAESTAAEDKDPSSLAETIDGGMEKHEDIIEIGESVGAAGGMKPVDEREGHGEAEESGPGMGQASGADTSEHAPDVETPVVKGLREDDGGVNNGGDVETEEDEELGKEGGEEEGVGEGGDGGEGDDDGEDDGFSDVEAEEGGGTARGEHRPTAPLFSFPPGPRFDRTEAEESLQEVLPVQQRLVKYLTDDKVFGAQILCSLYFVMGAVAFLMDPTRFSGCYASCLMALTIKHWGTVIGRVRRVLVPHLLYEPQRYEKYRAKVAALALDPSIQGIVYCGIFIFMPLRNALLPLLLKESVYLLWVAKEVLQIMSPALVETLSSMLEVPLSFLMTAGDVGKWRDTPEPEKRLLLGRRLAQMCFKLEMAMPFSAVLRVLPVVVQATLGENGTAAAGGPGGAGGEEGTAASAAAVAASGGVTGHIAKMLPVARFLFMMMAYVKLLTIRNGQLEDDIRVLRGLKIQGRNCEWVEQVIDSVIFGCIVGCPWWMGLLASAFAVLPNHDMTKAVMASDDKLKTLGMALLNLAIGRTPGMEDDDEDGSESEDAGGVNGGGDDDEASHPPGKMAKIAKVAAVAAGITDS